MRTRSELKQFLEEDLHMQGVDRWRAHYRLTRGVTSFQRVLRFAEYYNDPARSRACRASAGLFYRVWLRRISERLGFDVPRGAFGPGLSIAHSGLLIVSERSSVGARCRIHQGVTVGASAAGAPQIGDDVFIGPNALILGAVTIGDGALIYPGAVCVTDVPSGMAARGVPATLVSNDAGPWRPDAGPLAPRDDMI